MSYVQKTRQIRIIFTILNVAAETSDWLQSVDESQSTNQMYSKKKYFCYSTSFFKYLTC